MHSTRGDRWSESAYLYEMSDDDHRELARVLSEIHGMAVVSGYDSDLYNEIFADWRKVCKGAFAERNRPTVECLWMNFDEPRRLL